MVGNTWSFNCARLVQNNSSQPWPGTIKKPIPDHSQPLELQTQTFPDNGHCVSQPLLSLCLSPISTPLFCRILSFFAELAGSASPRSSLEPALKVPEGRKFQSSSSVLSLKRESELGVQKRESEMNPRSIFSSGLQPLTKLCQKVMGCFLQGA